MAEPSLDRPGVVALVGKGVAAGVAQHVRMRLEIEAGAGGGALDHPGEAGGRERGSPLADEGEGEGSLSRWSRRRARISSPIKGWVLGVPFLTRRTCSTAASNS